MTTEHYINVTPLVSTSNKFIKDYFKSVRCKELTTEIIKDTGLKNAELSIKQPGRGGNTLVHPLLAADIKKWCLGQPMSVNLQPEIFEIKSVTGHISVTDPQLYFGVPNGIFSNIINSATGTVHSPQTNEYVLKFGKTINDTRFPNHSLRYGGYTLLDTIQTTASCLVESELKKYLRETEQLFEGLHENKTSRDIELIVVSSQAQYRRIVERAKEIADTYSRASADDAKYLKESEQLRDQRVELQRRKHELEMREVELEIEKLAIERLKIQTTRNYMEQDTPAIPEGSNRYMEIPDLVHIFQIERVSGEGQTRAKQLWTAVHPIFRWTSVYKVAAECDRVLEWIVSHDNAFTARNHLVGLGAIVNSPAIRTMMNADLGFEAVDELVRKVSVALNDHISQSNKQQVRNREQQRADQDRMRVLSQITSRREVAKRLADTAMKKFGWTDVTDIARDPIRVSNYIESAFGSSVNTRNKHSKGLQAIMQTDVMRAKTVEIHGESAHADMMLVIDDRQTVALEAFTVADRARRSVTG